MKGILIKNAENVPSFLAGDKTWIKEVLHPKNDDIDLPYSVAFGHLEVGHSSRPHILHQQTEVYIILDGKGEINVDNIKQSFRKGDCFLVSPGGNQFVVNTGETILQFICIVSPPWQEEQEEIL